MGPARTSIRRVCAVALTAVLAAALSLTGSPAQAVDAMIISGHVTGPGGVAVPSAYVTILNTNGSGVSFGADDNGYFELGPVAAGTYRVGVGGTSELAPEWYDNVATIEQATPIVVTEGAVVPPVDIQLAVGGRIEGHLTAEGGVPATNLVVQVYRHNPASATEPWQIIGGVFANPSTGAYSIGGLPDGDYRVHFNDQSSPRKYLNEIYADNVQTLVTVAGAATVANIDGELTEGGHITGKITGGGVGLQSARATAYDATTGHQVAQANSDSQGNFDVRGLPTGSYKVEFQPNGGEYLSEFHLDALDIASATPVPVVVSETVVLEDTVLAPASKITGTVLGSDGLPLEEVRVTRIDVVDGVAEDSGGYHAETDVDGEFTISGLRAGTYRLAFEKPDSEYSREFFPDQDEVATAQDIVVDTADTEVVPATTLDLASTIRGQLTAPDGADPRVILHRKFGAQWRTVDTWSTESDGAFELLQLRAGTFRVEFKDLVSGTSRYWNGAKTFDSATDLALPPGGEATITGSLIDPVVTEPPSPSPSATPSQSPSPSPSTAPTIVPAPVLKTVSATKLPVIKGKPIVGRTLKVTAGSWNAPGVTRVLQWLANGKVIKKAIKAKLKMTRKLVGKKISVRIVVSAPGYLPSTVRIRRAGRVQAP